MRLSSSSRRARVTGVALSTLATGASLAWAAAGPASAATTLSPAIDLSVSIDSADPGLVHLSYTPPAGMHAIFDCGQQVAADPRVLPTPTAVGADCLFTRYLYEGFAVPKVEIVDDTTH